MSEKNELRKKWDKNYEERKKEKYTLLRTRIDIELKNKFKEKLKNDSNYADMSDFVIKSIKKYLK